MLEQSIQSPAQIQKIWRSLPDSGITAEAVLADFDHILPANGLFANRHDGLISAQLWHSLRDRQQDDTDKLIRTALEREANSGYPVLLLDVYASLVRMRLQTEVILSDDLKRDYALLLALSAPTQPLPSSLSDETEMAKDIASLFTVNEEQGWSIDGLQRLDAWPLIPILEALSAPRPDIDWLSASELATKQTISNHQLLAYRHLPATGLFALEQAAAQSQVAQAGLLAAILVQPISLGWLDLDDGARVVAALKHAGLVDAATAFGHELIKAYFLRTYFSASTN